MVDLFSSTFGSFWHNILPNLDDNRSLSYIYIVAFSVIFIQIWMKMVHFPI